MKVSTSDLLSILRKFDRAGDDDVPRFVERVQISHPSLTNTAASFRFKKTNYLVLFDESAEDRESYIIAELEKSHPNLVGSLLENPRSDLTTYGYPYKGKDAYLFCLDSGERRLDVVLTERHPELSRSSIQKYIRDGRVTVNGAVAHKPKTAVSDDDTVVLSLPDTPNYSAEELPIIYLDDDIIVVDKPIGVLSHAKNPLDDEFTVERFIARYAAPDLAEDRYGLVHRLDRDTSGVIIGARTRDSYDHLKQQFADRTVRKTYVAVTDGVPAGRQFRIDIPLGRHPSRPGEFRADPKGKSAQTNVEVLEANDSHALIELRPRTGRTHQLRVHLAHIGTPIHGDRLYGTAADRLYLHAHQLTVSNLRGESHTYESPVPAAFYDLVKD